MGRLIFVFILLSSLLGCEKSYSRQGVWEQYDYVPPSVQGGAPDYYPQPYYDNDDSYQIPYGFGVVGQEDNILDWGNQID